jgi:hypothetical protein
MPEPASNSQPSVQYICFFANFLNAQFGPAVKSTEYKSIQSEFPARSKATMNLLPTTSVIFDAYGFRAILNCLEGPEYIIHQWIQDAPPKRLLVDNCNNGSCFNDISPMGLIRS